MSLRFAPATFMIAFCAVYILSFWNNLPLFLYYPLHGLFAWGLSPLKGEGPGMAWYGFMANSAAAAFVLAWIIPDRLPQNLFRNFLWLFPCAAMAGCLYLVRQFFLLG